MAEKSIDISISFDSASYLNPQICLFADMMKDSISEDMVLHIVTNREKDDESLNYLMSRIPNHKIYFMETFKDLISRCKYLIHSVDIASDADFVLKMDLDVIPLKPMEEVRGILDEDIDVYIQMENRRIIPNDALETRIWRQIYRAMKIKMPDVKMNYIESDEIGLPLFNTGVFILKNELLNTASLNWSKLTKICEDWMEYGIHPNEFAATAMIFKYGWKLDRLNKRFNFNPIGAFRKGIFPSTELREDCVLPKDAVLLHWHKSKWLQHLMKYNKELNDRLKGLKYLESLWNVPEEVYMEKI